MTIRPAPACYDCKHFLKDEFILVPKCKAFPKEIPVEIFWQGEKHDKPFKGDRGIRFEAREGEL